MKISDGHTWDPPPPHTIDLDIDEARGDDAVLAVQLDVSRALLIEEQFLRVEDLSLSHPQVLPEGDSDTHLTPLASVVEHRGAAAHGPSGRGGLRQSRPHQHSWALPRLLEQNCSSSSQAALLCPASGCTKLNGNGIFMSYWSNVVVMAKGSRGWQNEIRGREGQRWAVPLVSFQNQAGGDEGQWEQVRAAAHAQGVQGTVFRAPHVPAARL